MFRKGFLLLFVSFFLTNVADIVAGYVCILILIVKRLGNFSPLFTLIALNQIGLLCWKIAIILGDIDQFLISVAWMLFGLLDFQLDLGTIGLLKLFLW